jgi:hypothetical protein
MWLRSEQVLAAASIAASLISQEKLLMSDDRRKIRFGLWYDFRNPPQWSQSSDPLYREILDQIAWAETNGFDDVWLSEHHFIEDGYLPSILPNSRDDWRLHPTDPHRIRGALDTVSQSRTPC